MNSRIRSEIWIRDALEVENALMDAFDLVGLNNPAIEDVRLIAGFFLVIAADRGGGNRPSCLEQGSLSALTGGSLRQKRPVVALERSNNPKELVMSELIQSESTPQIRRCKTTKSTPSQVASSRWQFFPLRSALMLA
jgi:hypothetical protein